MIKIPRYMKEFANARRENYINNTLLNEILKKEALRIIDNTLCNVEIGKITINEGMRILCNPIGGIE